MLTSYNTEYFFLGNTLLGQRKELHIHTNGGRSAIIFNKLYFCPECGEVWFRRVWSPSLEYNRSPVQWEAVSQLCSIHGPGTIILPHEHLDKFPLSVLQYEVLHLRSS